MIAPIQFCKLCGAHNGMHYGACRGDAPLPNVPQAPAEPLFLDASKYVGKHPHAKLAKRPRIDSPLGGQVVTRQVHLHGDATGQDPLVAADRLVSDFLGPLGWAFEHLWIEPDIRVRVGSDIIYPNYVHVHLRIAIDGRDYA